VVVDPLPDDPSTEDLAERATADGQSALDVVWATGSSLGLLAQALRQALIDTEPVVHPGVVDDSMRQWDLPAGVDIERALDQLGVNADAIAELAESVGHGQWDRGAAVAGGGEITPLAIAREAARTAAVGLSEAERCVSEVRAQLG
jgi:hypothetical protein